MIDDPLLRAIGKAFRSIRCENGHSQEFVAKELGVHRSYISLIERGETNLSLKTFLKICVILKCNPQVLLPDYFELSKCEKFLN